ncbi:uncharacterized protein SPAPADRAFT_60421 [Spathaspora passalidarum NRRL Y-27907]|uniref:Uncharacterized protein n=1 Tax=Spathaspora passalidarum (strain NRRL Y-27907 / 11-Y1) TaxID=619300 RepID=G3AL66_SPAPN|nr:uncharacterized protein SPAPADRAFT_60421 [Spathaspora passalidarum NRRL Y-27907]EGW33109.1 hypothetical protein SPAPADRAFT_60421 [Spathaspora passalidarum NRRL Y-27907]
MLRIKPVQTFSRSFSTTPTRHIATTINNGIKGFKPFTSASQVITNYKRGVVSFVTWTVAFYAVMFWPVFPRVISDFINDVPPNLTGINSPDRSLEL